MQNLVTQLAQQFGLKPEQVQAGAGVGRGVVEAHAGKPEFQALVAKIPGASAMLAQAQALPQQAGGLLGGGGGLLGQASGLLGALGGQGGGGLAGILGKLEGAGFNPESAMKFVPAALDQFKSAAGPETLSTVLDQVPVLKETAGGLLGKFLR